MWGAGEEIVVTRAARKVPAGYIFLEETRLPCHGFPRVILPHSPNSSDVQLSGGLGWSVLFDCPIFG